MLATGGGLDARRVHALLRLAPGETPQQFLHLRVREETLDRGVRKGGLRVVAEDSTRGGRR